MNATIYVIVLLSCGCLFAAWVWIQGRMNGSKVKGHINIRTYGKPITELVKMEDDDHVKMMVNGTEKIVLVRQGDRYSIRWPVGAMRAMQAEVDEILIDGVSFNAITLEKPDPKESAKLLAKVVKDTFVRATLKAWEAFAHQDDEPQRTSSVLIILLIVVVVLSIGGIGYTYYINSVNIKNIQAIYDGLQRIGGVK